MSKFPKGASIAEKLKMVQRSKLSKDLVEEYDDIKSSTNDFNDICTFKDNAELVVELIEEYCPESIRESTQAKTTKAKSPGRPRVSKKKKTSKSSESDIDMSDKLCRIDGEIKRNMKINSGSLSSENEWTDEMALEYIRKWQDEYRKQIGTKRLAVGLYSEMEKSKCHNANYALSYLKKYSTAKNNNWVIPHGEKYFPARHKKIMQLISKLNQKGRPKKEISESDEMLKTYRKKKIERKKERQTKKSTDLHIAMTHLLDFANKAMSDAASYSKGDKKQLNYQLEKIYAICRADFILVFNAIYKDKYDDSNKELLTKQLKRLYNKYSP